MLSGTCLLAHAIWCVHSAFNTGIHAQDGETEFVSTLEARRLLWPRKTAKPTRGAVLCKGELWEYAHEGLSLPCLFVPPGGKHVPGSAVYLGNKDTTAELTDDERASLAPSSYGFTVSHDGDTVVKLGKRCGASPQEIVDANRNLRGMCVRAVLCAGVIVRVKKRAEV